jgi:hypothetical protein
MLKDLKIAVSTKIAGVMKQVGNAVIPEYPETLQEAIEVIKEDINGLSAFQSGLKVKYMGIVRAKFSEKHYKASAKKVELIERAKKFGYYEPSYENLSVNNLYTTLIEKAFAKTAKK